MSTHTLIEAITLSSSASSVTFSSIPTDGTYRDLILIAEGDTGLYSFEWRLNGSTSSRNRVSMEGNGTSTQSVTATDGSLINYTVDNKWLLSFQVFDYNQTDKHKSIIARISDSDKVVAASANRWGSSNAVNSLSLYATGTIFAAGSTFLLYGIEA